MVQSYITLTLFSHQSTTLGTEDATRLLALLSEANDRR